MKKYFYNKWFDIKLYFTNYHLYIKANLNNIYTTLKNMAKSWTININLLILSVIPFIPMLEENVEVLQDVLSPENYNTLIVIITIINILLRFKTNSSIKDRHIDKDSSKKIEE